ncbi:MAG: A24 family peptidase [Caulobacteraceae bacterium]
MIAGLHLIVALILPLAMVVGAVRDATSYTIPNWLSAALALAFLPAAFVVGLSPAVIGISLTVGFAGLVAGVVMFALGWIGGGDAKLFAAASLWLGLTAIAPFLAWTGLAGGCLAVALLLLRRTPLANLIAGPRWVERLLEPKGDVPYGVAIAVGALAAFPASPILHAIG